jgi:general transcription factor 3C polypeptide 3 (transcription factor C subunit 4)
LNIARWFMKDYQFVTETYHLFAISSYFSRDRRKSLFHSAPSQKFLLRHVKAIDFTIPQDSDSAAVRPSDFRQERPILHTKDEHGEPIPAKEMDVALLALYGHLLYTGNSFTNALNYLFRAFALDPDNPVILLSIGLSYIHNSLKRQAENRHYMILQGLSFMQEYRRVREQSSVPQQRQEMEFNFARVYQLLGLGHLAVQGYEKCLAIGEEIVASTRKQEQNGSQRGDSSSPPAPSQEPENFTQEAAYALQTVYALSGELGMAKQVTERWLVL